MGNCCKREARELIVNRVEIKGEKNQKFILHCISEELTPNTFYRLIMNQPIPEEGEALPLFIKVREGTMFAPKVRVTEDENDCPMEQDFECGCEKRSALIPVDKEGLGNVAFGIDLSSCRRCSDDWPRRCMFVYLTNGGEFTLINRRRERDED